MPGNSGRNQHNRKYCKKDRPVIDENNAVLRSFQTYALELDTKHDRYETIVKMSRDITIESKRIIFLLHSIDIRKNNRDKILEEARMRLEKVIDVNFKAIAEELHGLDPYQFRGAYSPGLQEFIEAYTFMEYIKFVESENKIVGSDGEMSGWTDLQKKMTYSTEEASENSPECKSFFVDPTEYILGVSDLTGELMRRCINSLGSGETVACLSSCNVLQQCFTGYDQKKIVFAHFSTV